MPTAPSDQVPVMHRPIMRPLRYPGGNQITDATTGDLMSPRQVVLEYNELLDIVYRVAILHGDEDVVQDAQRPLRNGGRNDPAIHAYGEPEERARNQRRAFCRASQVGCHAALDVSDPAHRRPARRRRA